MSHYNPLPRIRIADLKCLCGSPDVIAIDPGQPPEISPSTDVVVQRGRAASGTCLLCWPVSIRQRPALTKSITN